MFTQKSLTPSKGVVETTSHRNATTFIEKTETALVPWHTNKIVTVTQLRRQLGALFPIAVLIGSMQ